jgi:cytochrome c-type biogenesis protein CcmF
MPWLTATAFLHSVMIQERRRMLKLWNLTLIILTFSLTLFGTFLTRSGIIGSVHAFTQGSIGIFFLVFLSLVMLGAFSLLAWRLERLRGQSELDSIFSRESAFLLNNLFLIAAAFTVFFGTVFPLLSEAIKGQKVSVGAPFFNLVNIPIFLALIFLMGVGPLIAWRRASAENLRRNFLMPVVIGVAGAALCRALGVGNLIVLCCMGLVAFVGATIALDFWRAARARRRTGDGWLDATWGLALRQNRRYGGFIVHLGILVVALGVAGSQAWSTQTEATINRGASVELAGYTIRFDDLQPVEESNHFKVVGTFTVSDRRGPYTVLTPAKKFYPQEQTPIAAVDYRLGFMEDLYLVLGDFARDGSHATIKVQINRMVSWLWIGGLILTLGAALAIVPEPRRTATRSRPEHAVVA